AGESAPQTVPDSDTADVDPIEAVPVPDPDALKYAYAPTEATMAAAAAARATNLLFDMKRCMCDLLVSPRGARMRSPLELEARCSVRAGTPPAGQACGTDPPALLSIFELTCPSTSRRSRCAQTTIGARRARPLTFKGEPLRRAKRRYGRPPPERRS